MTVTRRHLQGTATELAFVPARGEIVLFTVISILPL
jgi:hypothetical protein